MTSALKCTFIFTCLALMAKGQTLQSGPKLTDDRMWMIKSFVAEKNEKLFVLNMGTDVSQLECFDKNTLTSVFKKTIDVPYLRAYQETSTNPRELLDDHNLFYSNGKLAYLSSFFDKKAKEYKVLGQLLNIDSGEKSAELKTLAVAKLDKEQPKGEEYPRYHFLQSSDKKKILIISFYSTTHKSVQDGTDTKIVRKASIPESEFQYRIVDFDFNEIANGVIQTEGVARDFTLDANGHILYISSYPKDMDTYFDYSVWDYDTQAKTNKKLQLESVDKDVTSIHVKINDAGTFVAGYYNRSPEDKGIFCFKLNKEYGIENKLFQPIPNLQDESKKPNGFTNPLPTITDITFKKNGDIILLGECTNTYLYMTYRYSFMGKKTNTAYSPQSHGLLFFGNTVATCLDGGLKLKWTETFTKAQKLNFDAGYSSFGYLNTDDRFYCFYNDITTPVNIMIPPAAKGITTGIVNTKGEKTEKILGGVEPKILMKAALFYQNGKEYFAFGKSGKDQVLFKITE
jgi:hypothetical protein